MKRLIPLVAIVALAGLAATGCDRPKTTAYNNSGSSATPGSSTTTTTTTTPSSATTPSSSDTTSTASSSPSSTDTSSSTQNAASTPSSSSASNPAGANAVTDTVTTGKIKAAFASENGLKDSDISVTTEGGTVKLSGTVKSQDQISLAQNVAQRQDGVTKVDTSGMSVK